MQTWEIKNRVHNSVEGGSFCGLQRKIVNIKGMVISNNSVTSYSYIDCFLGQYDCHKAQH